MFLGFLQMRLERLPQLGVIGVSDHDWKGFDDLVFSREQVPELRGVEFAQVWKIVGRNESHGIPRGDLRSFVRRVGRDAADLRCTGSCAFLLLFRL
jgi:hypothetical protein